jgi:hypothetical protein
MKTKRVNLIEKIKGYFERKRIEAQIAERHEAIRQVRAEYYADKVRNYTISKDGYIVP